MTAQTPTENRAPEPADAVVLKVNRQSARVRLLGEQVQVTFRSRDVRHVVPGQLVTLAFDKRWTWRGDAYATGRMENPRIEVDKLGLVPLPGLRGVSSEVFDTAACHRCLALGAIVS